MDAPDLGISQKAGTVVRSVGDGEGELFGCLLSSI